MLQKYKFNQHIGKNHFNVEKLNEQLITKKDYIFNDMSLIYKSIAVKNDKSLFWSLDNTHWQLAFNKFYYKLFQEKKLPLIFEYLYQKDKNFFIKNTDFVKNLIKYVSWDSTKDQSPSIVKIINQLIEDGFDYDKKLFAHTLVEKANLHTLLFKILKQNSNVFNKNQLFVEYCKHGSVEHIDFFISLGCDIHYMNDLALIRSAEFRNEKMFMFLIDKHKFNPFSSNLFCFSTLLQEDNNISDDTSDSLIIYLANQVFLKKSKKINFFIKKYKHNNKFVTTLNYLTVNQNITINGNNKTKVNKI